MSLTRTSPPAAGGAERAPGRSRARRALLLVALAGSLGLVAVASLLWGVRDMGATTVITAVLDRVPGDADHDVVWEQRVPRTALGLVAGAALGLAGALLQGLTRNPIADPGLLGINAGASLAVVTAIATLGLSVPAEFVWFAFGGAAAAATFVYGVAALGPDGVTPVKLALIGAAVTATATSLITMMLLGDTSVLAEFRFWQVGALVNRPGDTITVVAPFVVVGSVLALASARFLNAMALGEDLARGLGQHVVRGRAVVLLAVVLTAASATSLVGPIAFVGLMVPHLARALVGIDYRWVLPCCAVLGPLVLLLADVLGRLVVRPGELEAGLVVAFVGGPALIWLVRHSRQVAM